MNYLHPKRGYSPKGWLPCCTDIAEMWWCLEKSEGKHKYIKDVLYVYNKDNSIIYPNSYYNYSWKKYRSKVRKYLENYTNNL